jgi:hypothetical protein
MNTKLLFHFADAIYKKQRIRLTFTTKEGQQLTRKCAPLDIAPSRRSKLKMFKFHVWDYESIPKPHVLSLSPEQIIHFEALDEEFHPEDIVTWDVSKARWSVLRNWGHLS